MYYANFRTTDDADGDQVTEGCGSGGCSVWVYKNTFIITQKQGLNQWY